MKEIYIIQNGKQKGPFAVDELRSLALRPDTLVWFKEIKNWTQIAEIDELTQYLQETPPPLPTTLKFDPNYDKRTDLIGFGVILVVSSIAISFLLRAGIFTINYVAALLVSALIRILTVVVVRQVSKDQNRNPDGWMLLALLTPAIALIIVGSNHRLIKPKSTILIELDQISKIEKG